MNKKLKATMLVAAVAAAGFGSYKAYNAYQVSNMSDAELLVVENLSALSSSTEYVPNGTVYVIVGTKTCWRYDESGNKRELHDKNGKLVRREKEYVAKKHYVAKCDLVDYREAPKYELCQSNTAKQCSQINASPSELSPSIQWASY